MYKILLAVLAVSCIQSSRAQDICTSSSPVFSAPGRRTSEQKCREYNWERKKVEQCTQDGEFNEYPYMGAVGYRRDGKLEYLCSSVLISPKFVVTTAHCAKGTPKYVLEIVRFGTKNVEDKVTNIDVKVIKTIIHPQYDDGYTSYDIALLELERELVITRAVMPACLWSGPEDPKQPGIIPGWARTRADGEDYSKTKTLRTMRGHVMDRAMCLNLVENWHFRKWRKLEDHQICVNETENREHTLCKGLSGSPLIAQVPLDDSPNDVMPYAITFAQIGEAKCRQGFSIYIRASSFIGWIESIVWPASENQPL